MSPRGTLTRERAPAGLSLKFDGPTQVARTALPTKELRSIISGT